MYYSIIRRGYERRLNIPIKVPVIFLLSIFWNPNVQGGHDLHSASGLLFILSYKAIQNWNYSLDDCLPDEEAEETDPTTMESSDWNRRERYLKYANTLIYDEYGAWWPTSDQSGIQSASDQTWKIELNDIRCEEWSDVCNSPDCSAVEAETEELSCPGILNCTNTVKYRGKMVTSAGESSLDQYQCMACWKIPFDDDNNPESIEGCKDKHIYCYKCAESFRINNQHKQEMYYCSRCILWGSFRQESRLKNDFLREKVYCPNGCGKVDTVRCIFDDHLPVCPTHIQCPGCNTGIEHERLKTHLKECFLKGDPKALETSLPEAMSTILLQNQILSKRVDMLEHVSKVRRLNSEPAKPTYEAKGTIHLGTRVFCRTPSYTVNGHYIYCFHPWQEYEGIPSFASIVRIEIPEPIANKVTSPGFIHMGYSFYISLRYHPLTGTYRLRCQITRGLYDDKVVWPFDKTIFMGFLSSTGGLSAAWSTKTDPSKPMLYELPQCSQFSQESIGFVTGAEITCSNLRQLRVNDKYVHVCFYFMDQQPLGEGPQNR